MNQAPRFESEFLDDLATAFRKRRKSLSHRAEAAEFSKVYELVGTEKVERLEINLPYWNRGALRLHAWPDRIVWLDARKRAKKGWEWVWTIDGRIIGDAKLPDIIKALGDTLSLLHEMDASRVDEFNTVWRPLIAQGPREVRQRP